MTLQEIIAEIPQLSIEERKQLVSVVFESLTENTRTMNLLDFEGVDEQLRDDNMDAQEYIDRLRDEWNE